MGDRFNLPYTRSLPIDEIIADCETIIKKHNVDDRDVLRSRVVNVITNFVGSYHGGKQHDSWISRSIKETRMFLSNYRERIIIVRADKGNITVIMDRDEYFSKALNLLGDSSTYKVLDSEPTVKIQNKNNRLVKVLLAKNIITEEEARLLTTNNGVTPKMFTDFRPEQIYFYDTGANFY
ncbi:uncharacterized protein LOC123318491 [Coccinella septempunctata]|uniref:uncharacterized protein LOC123318491 n=1 Tax=Coccinella septempunctata TaxID=41139 RepID=UPI001D08C214|nr:uncharacterized protein LOC123318491 [Coccinella septempunctata]